MHRGPSIAGFLSVVSALAVLAAPQSVSAGQTAAHDPDVVAGESDSRTEPSTRQDVTRRARRTVRSPLKDPWSVGVRVLWRSVAGSGGGWAPTTGGRGLPFQASCSAGGSCSPNGARLDAGPVPGIVSSSNGLSVRGVAFDAGRRITSGLEVGAGLDLTTHPGAAFLSTVSRAGASIGLREVSSAERAARVLAGESALQLDLAGRLTYRAHSDDAATRANAFVRPYVGVGAGASRYFAGFSGFGGLASDDARLRAAGMKHLATFEQWVPNLQIYGGFLVEFAAIAPMLDVDFRYVRARTHGVDLGGFRFGTGIRYPL